MRHRLARLLEQDEHERSVGIRTHTPKREIFIRMKECYVPLINAKMSHLTVPLSI